MEVLLDAAGRGWTPALTGDLARVSAGTITRNKGLRYPPDPPTVEEIVIGMRAAGDSQAGVRMRALIVLLWRAGLGNSSTDETGAGTRGPSPASGSASRPT